MQQMCMSTGLSNNAGNVGAMPAVNGFLPSRCVEPGLAIFWFGFGQQSMVHPDRYPEIYSGPADLGKCLHIRAPNECDKAQEVIAEAALAHSVVTVGPPIRWRQGPTPQ